MKTVKEIALCLNNVPGQLSDVSNLLGENKINIIAICATTGGEKGTIQFIANDPEKATNVLKTAGYNFEEREVIACEVPHHPGGLNSVLKLLKQANINTDYIYSCIGTGDITILIIGVGPIEEALNVLEINWIRIIGKDLYNM